jgi:hypothetical protein
MHVQHDLDCPAAEAAQFKPVTTQVSSWCNADALWADAKRRSYLKHLSAKYCVDSCASTEKRLLSLAPASQSVSGQIVRTNAELDSDLSP